MDVEKTAVYADKQSSESAKSYHLVRLKNLRDIHDSAENARWKMYCYATSVSVVCQLCHRYLHQDRSVLPADSVLALVGDKAHHYNYGSPDNCSNWCINPDLPISFLYTELPLEDVLVSAVKTYENSAYHWQKVLFWYHLNWSQLL